jgi:hypothetical protein
VVPIAAVLATDATHAHSRQDSVAFMAELDACRESLLPEYKMSADGPAIYRCVLKKDWTTAHNGAAGAGLDRGIFEIAPQPCYRVRLRLKAI